MKINTVLAVALVALLLAGVASAALPAAYAQTTSTNAQLSQTLQIKYTDGSFSTVKDTEFFLPAGDITGNAGKKISSVIGQLNVQLPLSTDKITYSGSSLTIKVLRQDGTYGTVSHIAQVNDYNIQKSGDKNYLIYKFDIPASALQQAIGPTAVDFPSEIRVATGNNVALLGTINGKTGTFHTSQTLTTFKVTSNPSGVTQDTGGSSSGGGVITEPPTVIKPTGKIYHTVGIKYTDGSARTAISQDIQTLAIIDPNAPKTSGNIVKEITYNMWLVLDQDAFQVAQGLKYADAGATDNYGATVNNQMVAKSAATKTEPFGSGYNYRLISMTVQADALGGIGTSGTNDHLKFYVKESTLTLTSVQKVFNISIPRQSVDIDLVNLTVTDETGGGEIDGEDFIETSDFGLVPLSVGIVLAGAAGSAVLLKRKKK